MMRSVFFLSIIALLLGTQPSGPLGIGIASVRVEPGVSFGLFSASDDTDPVATVELVLDESIQSVTLAPSTPEWLHPETLWLDYSLFAFRVMRASDESWEVVVNEESGQTLWIKRSAVVEFKPWERYLTEDVTALDRMYPELNPLRVAPDEQAASVLHEGKDCFEVEAVQGEWARVRTSLLCDYEGSDVERVEGLWLRWRDGDRLLVNYFLTC